jgi:hypothetical protein
MVVWFDARGHQPARLDINPDYYTFILRNSFVVSSANPLRNPVLSQSSIELYNYFIFVVFNCFFVYLLELCFFDFLVLFFVDLLEL